MVAGFLVEQCSDFKCCLPERSSLFLCPPSDPRKCSSVSFWSVYSPGFQTCYWWFSPWLLRFALCPWAAPASMSELIYTSRCLFLTISAELQRLDWFWLMLESERDWFLPKYHCNFCYLLPPSTEGSNGLWCFWHSNGWTGCRGFPASVLPLSVCQCFWCSVWFWDLRNPCCFVDLMYEFLGFCMHLGFLQLLQRLT